MLSEHYAVLELSQGSTKDEVKKAFRRLAHIHHPDKGGDEAKFKKITASYAILQREAPTVRSQTPPSSPFSSGSVFNGRTTYTYSSGSFDSATFWANVEQQRAQRQRMVDDLMSQIRENKIRFAESQRSIDDLLNSLRQNGKI